MVNGDLPKKVVIEHAAELAKPIAIIFNKVTATFEYPRQWIQEEQTPIRKVHPPLDENDLRNISGTPFFSKTYESFLADWLLPITDPYLDPGQCGGLSGSSISHYMVKLLNFIHSNWDNSNRHATLLAMVDLSKAFNRVSHQLVIEEFFDMHVPAWLLMILISYLLVVQWFSNSRDVSQLFIFFLAPRPRVLFLVSSSSL